MRRSATTTLVLAGALALTGTITGPARAAEGPDPDALAELVSVVDTDAASWNGTGGTLEQRCTAPDTKGTTQALGVTFAYEGSGGAAYSSFDLGDDIPFVFVPSSYYTGGRTGVVSIHGAVQRGLRKHGMRQVPTGTLTHSKSNATSYRSISDFYTGTAFGQMLDLAYWSTLTMTTDGTTTTWTGTPADDTAGQGTITLVARDGHLSTLDNDGGTYACKGTLSFARPHLAVPSVSERHNNVVADEAQMYFNLRVIAAGIVKKNGTATVPRVQRLAKHLDLPHTDVTSVPKGIQLSMRSKDWKHPLVWRATVVHKHLRLRSVAS